MVMGDPAAAVADPDAAWADCDVDWADGVVWVLLDELLELLEQAAIRIDAPTATLAVVTDFRHLFM